MRLRELAQARIRYGYRKLRVLLLRDGWQVGKKLVYRLYREEKLGLQRRPKARRLVSEHSRQKPRAERPNRCKHTLRQYCVLSTLPQGTSGTRYESSKFKLIHYPAVSSGNIGKPAERAIYVL